MLPKNTEAVKVAVRCRPLSEKEISNGRQNIVSVDTNRREIIIKNPKADINEPQKIFTFDQVYDSNSTQEQIYNDCAYPIVESSLDGCNGTIFAYGQTGSGKTYTIEGNINKIDNRGIIPRVFDHIFSSSIQNTSEKQFLVSCSFLEIYNEEVRDLLSQNTKNKLAIREKPGVGFYVKNLTTLQVKNAKAMLQKLSEGVVSRATAATGMNEGSSRSHSMYTITVERGEVYQGGKSHIVVGKLNLVDLAGSERYLKTNAVEERFKEGISINQSLTTLGNVISALTDPNVKHIPYRNSKLTRLLQDSLGGNTKTVMIANIGPADWNSDETEQTLRYANRAKSIKNKPKVNEDPKDTMLRQYNDEIMKLRAQPMAIQSGKNIDISNLAFNDKIEIVEKTIINDDSQKIQELQDRIDKEKDAIRQKAEEERIKIEQQKNLAIEKKRKLLEALKEKEEIEQKEKRHQEEMLLKLKDMEEKLLIGDKAAEKASKQERELQKARIQLEERRLAEAIVEKEDQRLIMVSKYKTQNEELSATNEKIQKFHTRYQQIRNQIQDQADDFVQEIKEYMDQILRLQRELKLRELMISTFIPEDETKKIEERARWDEESDEWVLSKAKRNVKRLNRPGSALDLKRPTSEYSLVAASLGDSNPRYKYENILQLGLDMPTKNTEEYHGRNNLQRLKNKVNTVLNDQSSEISIIHDENQPNIESESVLDLLGWGRGFERDLLGLASGTFLTLRCTHISEGIVGTVRKCATCRTSAASALPKRVLYQRRDKEAPKTVGPERDHHSSPLDWRLCIVLRSNQMFTSQSCQPRSLGRGIRATCGRGSEGRISLRPPNPESERYQEQWPLRHPSKRLKNAKDTQVHPQKIYPKNQNKKDKVAFTGRSFERKPTG